MCNNFSKSSYGALKLAGAYFPAHFFCVRVVHTKWIIYSCNDAAVKANVLLKSVFCNTLVIAQIVEFEPIRYRVALCRPSDLGSVAKNTPKHKATPHLSNL